MRLLALCLVLAASPASAGWRNTEWGMNEEEFRSAAPSEVTIAGKGVGVDLDMQFAVSPVFDGGKLVEVKLVPTENHFCPAAFYGVTETYGEPAYKTENVSAWESDGNVVLFSQRADSCVVSYQDPAKGQRSKATDSWPAANTTGF